MYEKKDIIKTIVYIVFVVLLWAFMIYSKYQIIKLLFITRNALFLWIKWLEFKQQCHHFISTIPFSSLTLRLGKIFFSISSLTADVITLLLN